MSEEERRRRFIRMKFDCLERVRDDVAAHKLPDKAFTLAFAIVQHINEETLEGYPGQIRLAVLIGASDRTVRTLSDKLIELGHLLIEDTRSRDRTFRYRMAVAGQAVNYGDDRKPASALNRKPASASETSNRKFRATKPEVSRNQTGSLASGKHYSRNTIHGTHSQRERVARQIPEDWTPTEQDLQFALKEGLPAEAINRQAERFLDYWRSSDKPKRDWSATWRNWIRREVDSRSSQKQTSTTTTQTRRNGGGARVHEFFMEKLRGLEDDE